MNITTELREFVDGLACNKVTRDLLREIADHIDQEHDREVFDLLREHDEWVHDRYANYIQLPKDADGQTIHFGDELEWLEGNRLTVNGIGEGGTLFYVDAQGDAQWTASGDKRHAKPDSWERIIADAAATRGDFDELVARCKRLAGEDA